MTSSRELRRTFGFAALAVVALGMSAFGFAGCGGGGGGNCGSNGMCPTYDDGTGTGWCKPGPNDCQACKVVLCPGYCLSNLNLTQPVPCGTDAGQ